MYVNYGDVNFFESGRLVDSEHSDTEFNILYCEPFCDEEDLYLFADCTVDIEADWIDKEKVMSFIGMNDDSYDGGFDAIQFALGCIEYYGVDEFCDWYLPRRLTKEEVCVNLRHYLIASDNLNIEW